MKTLLILGLAILSAQADQNLLQNYKKGNLEFTSNVYKEMAKTNSGNFLVCPMSVETVFALIHSGAKHNTAYQISDGFRFPRDAKYVQNLYKELSPSLQHSGSYNLSSANKVYLKNGFSINDNFKDVAVNVFRSEVQEIDFGKQESAVKEINTWVEEKTYNKIQNLLSKDDVSEDTRMVIVNAMYFKGTWYHEFHEGNTQKRKFYLNNKNTVDVDMMEITKRFQYYNCEESNSQYLVLPFVGSDITMTFILPNEKEGLAKLEENIEKTLEIPNYTFRKIHLRLPKFEMGSKIQFFSILNKLGIVDAFSGNADFSGINANDKIQIDKVIQKTYIKVEEKGTTAAAATALIAVGMSAMVQPVEIPKEFFLDHPFIYVLRNANGIMFVGRYISNEN